MFATAEPRGAIVRFLLGGGHFFMRSSQYVVTPGTDTLVHVVDHIAGERVENGKETRSSPEHSMRIASSSYTGIISIA